MSNDGNTLFYYVSKSTIHKRPGNFLLRTVKESPWEPWEPSPLAPSASQQLYGAYWKLMYILLVAFIVSCVVFLQVVCMYEFTALILTQIQVMLGRKPKDITTIRSVITS